MKLGRFWPVLTLTHRICFPFFITNKWRSIEIEFESRKLLLWETASEREVWLTCKEGWTTIRSDHFQSKIIENGTIVKSLKCSVHTKFFCVWCARSKSFPTTCKNTLEGSISPLNYASHSTLHILPHSPKKKQQNWLTIEPWQNATEEKH